MLMLELGVVFRLRDWRPSRLLALLGPLSCGIIETYSKDSLLRKEMYRKDSTKDGREV